MSADSALSQVVTSRGCTQIDLVRFLSILFPFPIAMSEYLIGGPNGSRLYARASFRGFLYFDHNLTILSNADVSACLRSCHNMCRAGLKSVEKNISITTTTLTHITLNFLALILTSTPAVTILPTPVFQFRPVPFQLCL